MRHLSRPALGVLVCLLLVGPVASSASWLQTGSDPGRTGATPFEGPQTNDTAFQVELPGSPWMETALVDGTAYVATADAGLQEGLDTSALWSIDLATGSVEKLIDLPPDWPFFVSPEVVVTGERREVQGQCCAFDLVAIEVPSGEERWRLDIWDEAMPFGVYSDGVTVGETFYAAFVGSSDPYLQTTREAGVVAVDLGTGDQRWRWQRGSDAQTLEPEDVETPQDRGMQAIPVAISADQDRVYPYIQVNSYRGEELPTSATAETYRVEYELWGLDGSEGESLWKRSDSQRHVLGAQTPAGEVEPVDEDVDGLLGGYAAVSETHIHVRLDAFEALNPATGDTVWTSPAGRSDEIQEQGTLAMGVRGATFVGTSSQTIYRLDAVTGDLVWQRSHTDPDKLYEIAPIVLSSDTAYAGTWFYPGPEADDRAIGLEAVDLETGELEWAWRDNPEPVPPSRVSYPAFGPGVVVYPVWDGTVHVLGRTDASLGAPAIEQARYPQPGEEFTLDLSETEPGAFGPATRYRVFWGDGTVSGWKASPEFSHVYNETGNVEARVQAGNEANQTASAFVTMNVGQEKPTEPNWLSERFEPENQDMTFGVLGLAVALGGGAIGIARRKRKQSILQEELEALEEGFERTRENPGECEAFLDTRKARAQSLLLDGDLEEEQFGVLERRIDGLHGELRTSVLDQRFQFLPHGMVQSLKRMLADGRISAWEREAVADLLDREESLTDAQKETVRSQLDRWFAEDAGGGER